MFYKEIAIQILLSMLYLSSTVNDNKSNDSDLGFATNNNIVSDVNERVEGQWKRFKRKQSIADSFVENVCPLDFNTAKLYFPSWKFNQAKNWNVTVEQKNLRLYAETSSDNLQIVSNGFKTQAFINESINYIFRLHESQKFLIALSYIYAICNFYGYGIWTLISKIRFGKPNAVVPSKCNISLSEQTDDLPTTPSEKSIIVEHDTKLCDHCDMLKHPLKYQDGFFLLNCTCGNMWGFDPRERVEPVFPTDVTSLVRELFTAEGTFSTTSEPGRGDVVIGDGDSWESSSEESCEDDIPDKFFPFSSDCGNVEWVLNPDDWEKIEAENSSQEHLTSDVEGTFSTTSETRQGDDVVSDGDSWESSSSRHHSPVPMEMACDLSCADSDGDPMSVISFETTNGCNEVTSSELSYDELTSDLDSSFDFWEDECSEHGSTVSLLRPPDSESDISVDEGNKRIDSGLLAGYINHERWVAINPFVMVDIIDTVVVDIIKNEDEISEEHTTVVMTFEQRVKNHAFAAAFFTGTFLLPCFIAGKLLK